MSDLSAQKPTSARYWVVFFGVTLAMVLYIDRICISKASGAIRETLNLDASQMGWVFSAFTFAYAIFEIPAGWLGDKYGPRLALFRVVIWWSLFTAATGWTWGFISLVIVRFLFGMGEAGCFPNVSRAFLIWLQPRERVRAQGILWLGARWAGALTPFLVLMVLNALNVVMSPHTSWRVAFAIFGAIGIVWAIAFRMWFQDDPAKHPSVNEAERELLKPNAKYASGDHSIPWGAMVRSPNTWLIWAQYFFLSYAWYFYITWLPTFLDTTYSKALTPNQLALLNGVPLFCGGIGCIFSGFFAKHLMSLTGSVWKVRKIFACTGFTLSAAAFLLSAHFNEERNAIAVIACLGAASFFGDWSLPGSWDTCMEFGGKHAGVYSGAMNMMGNLGGAVAPVVAGYILASDKTNFLPILQLSAAASFLAGVCWLLMKPGQSLEDHENEAALKAQAGTAWCTPCDRSRLFFVP